MATAISPTGRYTPTEASRLMCVSRSTVYNFINDRTVSTIVEKRKGVLKLIITGLEIMRFNLWYWGDERGKGYYNA